MIFKKSHAFQESTQLDSMCLQKKKTYEEVKQGHHLSQLYYWEILIVVTLTLIPVENYFCINPAYADDRISWENEVSIIWLIPWLLVLPGHQQPCFWLCSIYGSLTSLKKDFSLSPVSNPRKEKMLVAC